MDLPPLLAAFVAAKNAHDSAAFTTCFAPYAVVWDEGRAYHGHEEIRRWFEEAVRRYRFALQVTGVTPRGANTQLTGLLSGDFPGSPVELHFHLVILENRIVGLNIVA